MWGDKKKCNSTSNINSSNKKEKYLKYFIRINVKKYTNRD